MIFTNDIVFIHIPKTGGMSCADYLLHALEVPIYNCHAEAAQETQKIGRRGIIPIDDVNRHCTLAAADQHLARLTGKSIGDKKLLLAVIRHPFSLEFSFFMHLQKPHVISRRAKIDPESLRLAQGDFKTFVAQAGYLRKGMRQQDYFLVDGEAPANLRLLRFEEIAVSLPLCVRDYCARENPAAFPHINRSAASDLALRELLDEETRMLIYRKHSYLFDQGYYSVDALA